jgi:hypothetical protein
MYLNNERPAVACKYCGKMIFWYTDRENGKRHSYENRHEPNLWHRCNEFWKSSAHLKRVSNFGGDVSQKQTVQSYARNELEVELESRQVWTYACGNVIAISQNQEKVSEQEAKIKNFLEGTIHQTMGRITLRGLLEYHREIEFFDVWLPTNQIKTTHIKHGVEFHNRIKSVSTIQGKRIWFQDHIIREL